jgi:hypothetical protein
VGAPEKICLHGELQNYRAPFTVVGYSISQSTVLTKNRENPIEIHGGMRKWGWAHA